LDSNKIPSFMNVDIALQNAYALYKKRSEWLPPSRRIEIFGKAIHIMARQSESLAVEAAREGGKPLIDSRVEVARAIEGLKICIEHLRTHAGTVIPTNINAASSQRLAFTQKEPIGVVVAVSAFNHPLNLIVHQVGAAVVAGCPTIVKPAKDTPLSCLRFVQILRDAGLPDAWCQVVITENRQVATKLVTDSRVGFFSFIGSAKIGWMLRSQLAPGTRCALEHGGAAPVIVAQDADLDTVIPSLSKGGFYHAGQVCVSVQRVFAHESIASTLAERLATAAKQLKIGDPTQAETDIGPLIRHAEVKRVHQWVSEAIDSGAERLAGGEPISDSCYPATVLFKPPLEAKVSQPEIFGPVVCVYSYQDMDEAITQANSLPYAFQAAVFTKDLDTALRAYRQLEASAVMVNDHTAFRIDGMPFAGLKESGLGVGGIPYTIEDMQVEKMMVIKSMEL
jgi:acyl-CoA reductase-like NAD-dependent aldehyde dehydrogenase